MKEKWSEGKEKKRREKVLVKAKPTTKEKERLREGNKLFNVRCSLVEKSVEMFLCVIACRFENYFLIKSIRLELEKKKETDKECMHS